MRVNAAQFIAAINYDLDWLKKNQQPIEIYQPIDLSSITSRIDLTPNLLFSGIDKKGYSIHIRHGKVGKLAGTTIGAVFAQWSNINSTSGLIVQGIDENGISADFRQCKQLLTAEGKYKGAVSYTEANIKTIGDLEIENPAPAGSYFAGFKACLLKCPLEKLPRHLNPKEFQIEKRLAAVQRLVSGPTLEI